MIFTSAFEWNSFSKISDIRKKQKMLQTVSNLIIQLL